MIDPVTIVSLGVVVCRVAVMLNEARKQPDLGKKLETLRETIRQIETINKDHEAHEGTSKQVAYYLRRLEEVGDDVKNVLRLIEAENDQFTHNQTSVLFRWMTYRSFASAKEISVRISMIEEKILLLEGRLKAEKAVTPTRICDPPGTTSATLGAFIVRGRMQEVEEIVDVLTEEGEEKGTASGVEVLPICGMGGIGKTTLAREVYHDWRVQQHFDLRMWVHVSCTFEPQELLRMILKAAGGSAVPSSARNLDVLEKDLMKKVEGRRFLLVLDDVWTFNKERADAIKRELGAWAKGGWVLVTARNQTVAHQIGDTAVSRSYTLRGLSDEDCRSIILEHAGPRKKPPDAYVEQLSKKCRGVPLVAMAYGNWLRGKASKLEDEAEIPEWDKLEDQNYQILERLKLSYQNLRPPHLKKCFRYCAVFPEGYSFDREKMALYWMAADCIEDDAEYPEAKGRECFDSLVRASFFMDSREDHSSSNLVMHKFLHDMSRNICGDFCSVFRYGEKDPIEPSENTRHLCFIYNRPEMQKGLSPLRSITNCPNLNTLILLGDALHQIVLLPYGIVQNFKCLHTLDLSYTGIETLDVSVLGFKCLRFLGLSNTRIKMIPPSLNELYRLQTLLLRNCYELKKLPQKLGDMECLRHLDLAHDGDFLHQEAASKPHEIGSMPDDIGKLIQLQTLPIFVIGSEDACSSLKELKKLRGDLYISNLQMVSDAEKAKEADLEGKEYINRLKLEWAHSSAYPSPTEDILENLKPNCKIEELWIKGYQGIRLPTWIKCNHLVNIRRLKLDNCSSCTQIPSLVHLPSLEHFHVKGMDGIRVWDCREFCGTGKSVDRPCLTTLEILDMPNWEMWLLTSDRCCGVLSLRELVIKNCPKLLNLAHGFPALESMVIKDCPKPIFLADRYDSLQYLVIENCPSLNSISSDGTPQPLQWSSFRELRSLALTGVASVSILDMKLDVCHSITKLQIGDLPDIETIPEEWLPPQLKYLAINKCPQLVELPQKLCRLSSLEDLMIEECERIDTLAENLRSLGQLRSLVLSNCSNISYLPTRGLPEKLRILKIKNCPVLEKCLEHRRGRNWATMKTVQSLHINEEYYHYGELYSTG